MRWYEKREKRGGIKKSLDAPDDVFVPLLVLVLVLGDPVSRSEAVEPLIAVVEAGKKDALEEVEVIKVLLLAAACFLPPVLPCRDGGRRGFMVEWDPRRKQRILGVMGLGRCIVRIHPRHRRRLWGGRGACRGAVRSQEREWW